MGRIINDEKGTVYSKPNAERTEGIFRHSTLIVDSYLQIYPIGAEAASFLRQHANSNTLSLESLLDV